MRAGLISKGLKVQLAVKKRLNRETYSMDSVGIYGIFRVASIHPAFGYEVGFVCEPPNNDVCEDCTYKFKCFTDEEVHTVFRGKTLGIFPDWWLRPEPSASELEQYLFGRKTGWMKFRTTYGNDKIYYGKERV